MILDDKVLVKGENYLRSKSREKFYKDKDHFKDFQNQYNKLYGYDNLDILSKLEKYLTNDPEYEFWTTLRIIHFGKDINILDFKYSISSNGRLWSHARDKELLFYINKDTHYYARPVDGISVSWHRAVLGSFYPITNRSDFLQPNELHVNHKNCRPSDNRLLNLEWMTRKENFAHMRNLMSKTDIFYPKPIKITLAFDIGNLKKGEYFYLPNRNALTEYGVPSASIRNAISKGIYMYRCYFETVPINESKNLTYGVPDILKSHFKERIRIRKKLIQNQYYVK